MTVAAAGSPAPRRAPSGDGALTWAASWSPSMLRLAASTALLNWHAAAVVGTSLAWTALLRGGPALGAATLGLTTAVSVFLHHLASVPIVPVSQGLGVRLARAAADSAFLERHPLLRSLRDGLLRPYLAMIADASRFTEEGRAAILRAPGAMPVSLRTPDGIALDGVYWRADPVLGGPPPSLLIYAGGNGEHWEYRGDLAAIPLKYGIGVLAFNYRGVGRSSGSATKWGGVLDVATAVAFAREGLGIPEARIMVWGHSIGGGFASLAVPTIAPAALLIHDRSFARLSDAAEAVVLGPPRRAPLSPLGRGAAAADSASPPLLSSASLLRRGLRLAMVAIVGWELDAAAAWRRHAGPKLLVTIGPADRMIPPFAQLLPALEANGGETAHVAGAVVRLSHQPGTDAHNRWLEAHEAAAIFGSLLRDGFLRGKPLPRDTRL